MKGTNVGDPIPAGDLHGISVQLPKWEHTVGWSKRDPKVLDNMQTGYPRFFIPIVVDNLSKRLIVLFGLQNENFEHLSQECNDGSRLGLVLQTDLFAKMCKDFLVRKGASPDSITAFSFGLNGTHTSIANGSSSSVSRKSDIHIVSYPAEHFPAAKAFWQHTGFGISSRCAEYWFKRLDADGKSLRVLDQVYQRNEEEAGPCKRQLCQRLADQASTAACSVDANDVFLYPTGMSAITHTATALAAFKPNQRCKAAIFGFLYVDTFKVVTTVCDFDYLLYGHASNSELDKLEQELAKGNKIDALYMEIPGNPLLRSPDLERIYALSKKYDFLVIVDDTVATSINLAVMDACDIICTSLSKMFSGACNVMGGALILNPKSPHFKSMKDELSSQFVDTYFPLDVIVMEQNSRDFAERVLKANDNSEAVYHMLTKHRTVTQVYYPKDSPSQHIYDSFKRPDGGYGFLLSITFVSPACAIAFHDELNVNKGPSLGTNFTLACAYTLLAHAKELEWAAEHGLVEHLVRISIGFEDRESLLETVRVALEAADTQMSNDHA